MRVSVRLPRLWALATVRRPSCNGERPLNTHSVRTWGVQRLFASSSHDVQSFNVRCGSSGFVTVDIYNSQYLTSPSRPLVVYLPPTGVHLQHTHPTIPSFLRAHPLAAINYRWNYISTPLKPIPNPAPFTAIPSSHPFPTPLHDTLHAYTWLTNQYLPSITSTSPEDSTSNAYPIPQRSPRSPSPYTPKSRSKNPPRPLIIYGSNLGGTIATSLALTESKSSRSAPIQISRLIVRNGIFDWTGVVTSQPADEEHSRPLPTEEVLASGPWTHQTLHKLRDVLFVSPASAFDAFVSPLLFFRTPRLSVPQSPYFPGCDPPAPPASPASSSVDLIEGLSLSDAEYAALATAEPPANPSSSSSPRAQKGVERKVESETVRAANLKFPPRDSGLRIPRSLFLSTRLREEGDADHVLAEQALEMVRLMRRSIVLHEFKERALWDEDLDPHAASEERVQLRLLGGGDGQQQDEDEEVRVVKEWLEGVDS